MKLPQDRAGVCRSITEHSSTSLEGNFRHSKDGDVLATPSRIRCQRRQYKARDISCHVLDCEPPPVLPSACHLLRRRYTMRMIASGAIIRTDHFSLQFRSQVRPYTLLIACLLLLISVSVKPASYFSIKFQLGLPHSSLFAPPSSLLFKPYVHTRGLTQGYRNHVHSIITTFTLSSHQIICLIVT